MQLSRGEPPRIPGELESAGIIAFLLLEPSFPRSVLHCISSAKESVAAISAEVNPHGVDPAERLLGRLNAQLEYLDPAELPNVDLPQFLSQIVQQTAQAALAVQKSYFLH